MKDIHSFEEFVEWAMAHYGELVATDKDFDHDFTIIDLQYRNPLRIISPHEGFVFTLLFRLENNRAYGYEIFEKMKLHTVSGGCDEDDNYQYNFIMKDTDYPYIYPLWRLRHEG